MTSFRIVLADDHALARAGLRAVLESIEDVAVVAEAADGLEAHELTRHERPDVVVLDLAMPGMSGLDVAERLRVEMPDTHVVIVSVHVSAAHVAAALAAGVSAYVEKTDAVRQLPLALAAVARGETWVAPGLQAAASRATSRVLGLESQAKPGAPAGGSARASAPSGRGPVSET